MLFEVEMKKVPPFFPGFRLAPIRLGKEKIEMVFLPVFSSEALPGPGLSFRLKW